MSLVSIELPLELLIPLLALLHELLVAKYAQALSELLLQKMQKKPTKANIVYFLILDYLLEFANLLYLLQNKSKVEPIASKLIPKVSTKKRNTMLVLFVHVIPKYQ
jgi:hypothetical protein